MSESQSAEIRFGESGEESLQNYRSVSRTAVVGLVLGVASALALVHWLLLAIAFSAVLVSSLALAQIRARSGELLGRKLALAGLVLGIFFLAFAATREYLRRSELNRQARQHADNWLDLIREGGLPNLYTAYELQERYHNRQPAGSDLAVRYGDPAQFKELDMNTLDDEMMELHMPQIKFNTFIEKPIIQKILAAGNESEIEFEFVEVAGQIRQGDLEIVVLEYLMRYTQDGRSETSRFWIKMARNYYDDLGEGHWHVQDISSSPFDRDPTFQK